MTPKQIRQEMNKLKKTGNVYQDLGGKDDRKEIHHNRIPVAEGGPNEKWNLCYLFEPIHTMYHHLRQRNEIDKIVFRGTNPSLQKQCDDIADGCIQKVKKDLFMQDVRNDMMSR